MLQCPARPAPQAAICWGTGCSCAIVQQWLASQGWHCTMVVQPRVLSMLRAGTGFGVGHTRETETKGIWVWGQPQLVDDGAKAVRGADCL